MKRHSSYILTSTLAVASILLVGGSHRCHQTTTGIATRDTEAAFRDGVQAKLDVQNGRKPRIASGRWSTNRDRGLFIAGYQQSYRDSSQSQSRTFTEPSAAELAGYWDGMHDGSEHRRTSQMFQFNKTDRYRTAGHGYLEINSDPNTYKQDYRLAYSNGYQQGYYSQQEQEQVELKTASDTTGRW